MGEEKKNIVEFFGKVGESIMQHQELVNQMDAMKNIRVADIAPFERITQTDELMLEEMRKINENTSQLPNIVSLLEESNQTSKDMLKLFSEMSVAIASANSKEEAESIVRETINQANSAKETLDTIVVLANYGKAFIKTVFPDIGS